MLFLLNVSQVIKLKSNFNKILCNKYLCNKSSLALPVVFKKSRIAILEIKSYFLSAKIKVKEDKDKIKLKQKNVL